MKNKTLILIICSILVIIIGSFVILKSMENQEKAAMNGTSSSTSTPIASNIPVFDKSISDGTITVKYPSEDFGLATNQVQVLTHAYIPPCEAGFNYCFYFKGSEYQGTNFESAGFRIQKRADLQNEKLCLNTPPSGFDATKMPDLTQSQDTYSISVFNNVGDAGAGHYAEGSLYRLFIRNTPTPTCYEFETRIGQTQFANYPAGSIKEFSTDDLKNVRTELNKMLNSISFEGTSNIFQ